MNRLFTIIKIDSVAMTCVAIIIKTMTTIITIAIIIITIMMRTIEDVPLIDFQSLPSMFKKESSNASFRALEQMKCVERKCMQFCDIFHSFCNIWNYFVLQKNSSC